MFIDELSISGGNVQLTSGSIDFNTFVNFNSGSNIEQKLDTSGQILASRDDYLQSQIDVIGNVNAYQILSGAVVASGELLQSGIAQVNSDLIASGQLLQSELNTSGQILSTRDTEFQQTIDYFSGVLFYTGGVSGLVYNNPNPSTVTVGGIPAGTTFNMQTVTQIFDMLFYPYQSPAFTAFSINGQSTSIEVGTAIASGLVTFNWATSNSSNVATNSIIIKDVTSGNIVIGSGLANTGSSSLSLPYLINKTTNTSHVWNIQGTNTHSSTFNTNFTVNWLWRYYWGFRSATTIDSSGTLALQSSTLASSRAGNFTLPTNPGGLNYIYFVYPNSFGALTSIYDNTNAFNVTADFTNLGTISVTNTNSIVNTYTVYRSINAIGGGSGFNYTLT